MKCKHIVIALLVLFNSNIISAQKKNEKFTTVEFKVSGVCSNCKERIENGALIKGVKFAEWDLETSKIKVIFHNKKTDELSIHNAIAEVGYDTEKVKADSAAYKKLPDCCAYRDGIEKH